MENHKDRLLAFFGKENRMPTYSEAMKLFGFKSKNAVSKVFQKLCDSGFVEKDHLGRLQPTKLFGEIPFLGLVTAGLPAEAPEIGFDTMKIEDFLVDKKESTYILEVTGDSMIDAHIEDGDRVIAEMSQTAKDGQIVIAEVDGEWTMKYFKQKGDKVWLLPANKNYKPIYPKESFRIGAIVKGIIRKY